METTDGMVFFPVYISPHFFLSEVRPQVVETNFTLNFFDTGSSFSQDSGPFVMAKKHVYISIFYRTQVNLGPNVTPRRFEDLTDVTLADEDTTQY